jgi:hypothetical protein
MEIHGEDLSVLEAVCKDKVHLGLCHVRVEPGRLVATDGRMLSVREVRMEEGEAPFEPFLLEPKAFKTAAGKGAYLYAGENGAAKVRSATVQHGVMHANGSETLITKAEGTFPDYTRVIPAEERDGQVSVLVNPALLMKFLKTFDGIECVRLTVASAKEGVRVDGETPDGRKVLGVIMPMGK